MLATFASTSAPSAAIVPLNLLLAGLALFGALVFRAKTSLVTEIRLERSTLVSR